MKFCLSLAVASAVTVVVLASPAHSQPAVRTSYTYYDLSGDSLADLRRELKTRSPTFNGQRAYGLTVISRGQDMTVANCKKRGAYRISVNVSVKLPRVADTSSLTASDITAWKNFSQFVRKHEDTHRSIWRQCLSEMSRKFDAGDTRNCENAQSRFSKLWNEMLSSCGRKHVAFDQSQRSVFKSHPFMKYASR